MSDTPPLAALPFSFRRSSERMDASSYSSTTHTVHGLLLLHEDRLVLQWRTDRKTQHLGAASMETDREIDPVREHVVPLASVAGAAVRTSRWPFVQPRFVLRAADLLAFEDVTGAEGLELDHPGELPLRIRRADLLAAEEFAAELALANARGGPRVAAGPSVPRVGPDRAPPSLPETGSEDAMTSQDLAVREPPRVETDQLSRNYRHMEWADATIWRAALSDRAYAEDDFVRASLHHIHFVQRAFLGVWTGEGMDGGDEDRFEDAEAVARWGREAHPRIRDFVEGLDRSRLGTPMSLPWAAHLLRDAGLEPDVTSLEETLHQLAAHSSHHRAQVNRRLRVLGAQPPPIDYIFWAWIGRPEADWPV